MNRFCGLAAAALAAAATCRGEELTFDGYLPDFAGSAASLQASVCGRTATVTPGTNGYVNVTVGGIDARNLDGGTVTWTFKRDGTSVSVAQALVRPAFALVAERAGAVRPLEDAVEVNGTLAIDSAEAAKGFAVEQWQAPGAKVVFGGEDASGFTVSNVDVRLSADGSREGQEAMLLLGAARTRMEVSVRGGETLKDGATFTAPGDGLLEVLLEGRITYSDANQGYGPGKVGRDGTCRLCAMVGMDFDAADGAKPLSDVFGAFGAAGGSRPWIVPFSANTRIDGKMVTRVTLPMRRGDRFSLELSFAEFLLPGSDRVFEPVSARTAVGSSCFARGTMDFHAFGGER